MDAARSPSARARTGEILKLENCAQTVVKLLPGGAAKFCRHQMTPSSEELRDGVAVAFVPDFSNQRMTSCLF